jgi:hypothetical protein
MYPYQIAVSVSYVSVTYSAQKSRELKFPPLLQNQDSGWFMAIDMPTYIKLILQGLFYRPGKSSQQKGIFLLLVTKIARRENCVPRSPDRRLGNSQQRAWGALAPSNPVDLAGHLCYLLQH